MNKRNSWRKQLALGYTTAAQWSSTVGPDDSPADDFDLAKGEALTMGLAVCRWARGHEEALDRAADLLGDGRDWTSWERFGHDVWLSQVGHGCGFWDRTELDADGLGDMLTKASRELGEDVYTFLNDDGEVEFDGLG